MASIRTKPTGSKAIQIVMPDGARRAIGIGKVGFKAAESFRVHVGHIESAHVGGHPIPPATAKWVAQTKPQVRRRLEELGMIEPQAEQEGLTIHDLIERYLADLTVKPRTIVRYRNHTQPLRDYFGNGRDVAGITAGDADRWLRWLRQQEKKIGTGRFAVNYIFKIVQTSRQAFAAAVKDNLLAANPLANLRVPEQVSVDRDFEISLEMTERILNAANPKYRLIVALARYAGLRIPSELIGLRWSEVAWSENRFIVHSPKTEHCGKFSRIVPIFRELLPYLLDARELAPDDDDRIFPDIHENSNLRTETLRVLKRSGVGEIPRFFQNCRSSRQTELEAEFPLHVVCSWLGNSERTARKHYLKTRECHFEKAAGAGVSQGVQKIPAKGCKESQQVSPVPMKTQEPSDSAARAKGSQYARQDSNLRPAV